MPNSQIIQAHGSSVITPYILLLNNQREHGRYTKERNKHTNNAATHYDTAAKVFRSVFITSYRSAGAGLALGTKVGIVLEEEATAPAWPRAIGGLVRAGPKQGALNVGLAVGCALVTTRRTTAAAGEVLLFLQCVSAIDVDCI